MRFIIAMIIDLDLLKFKCFKIDKKKRALFEKKSKSKTIKLKNI